MITSMKHLKLNKMDERDAEGWQGEQHSIQVDDFLNQYAQIVTNIGQGKGQIVKGIIKAVNILKHFVISREPTNNSEASVYAGRASQAEYMVGRLVYTNQAEGEVATAAELSQSKSLYKDEVLNVQKLTGAHYTNITFEELGSGGAV
jgi:hypothetical protein